MSSMQLETWKLVIQHGQELFINHHFILYFIVTQVNFQRSQRSSMCSRSSEQEPKRSRRSSLRATPKRAALWAKFCSLLLLFVISLSTLLLLWPRQNSLLPWCSRSGALLPIPVLRLLLWGRILDSISLPSVHNCVSAKLSKFFFGYSPLIDLGFTQNKAPISNFFFYFRSIQRKYVIIHENYSRPPLPAYVRTSSLNKFFQFFLCAPTKTAEHTSYRYRRILSANRRL